MRLHRAHCRSCPDVSMYIYRWRSISICMSICMYVCTYIYVYSVPNLPRRPRARPHYPSLKTLAIFPVLMRSPLAIFSRAYEIGSCYIFPSAYKIASSYIFFLGIASILGTGIHSFTFRILSRRSCACCQAKV